MLHRILLYLSASNEFIAMKKIIAMKIHRNEKGKFIAFKLLTIFQRILVLFEENFKWKSNFLTKLMYKNVIKRLGKGIFWFQGSEIREMTTFQRNLGFFEEKLAFKTTLFSSHIHRFIAMISEFSSLHRNEWKVQWFYKYKYNIS